MILESRGGTSTDPKPDALLRFAQTVVKKRGVVEDADLAAVPEAGYGDAEIAEVVAHVALNIFTNYFNSQFIQVYLATFQNPLVEVNGFMVTRN